MPPSRGAGRRAPRRGGHRAQHPEPSWTASSLVALAPLLIAELGLSRAQIGLLVGVSFIVVFAVGTLVVGVLADRSNRPRLIALGLAVWSGATALTATASGMASLVAWRLLVGVGEAALPATALAMIGDRVPARRLGLATGVFYAGVPIGFALSFALSGLIGPWLGWRACFLAARRPGPRRHAARAAHPGSAPARRRARRAAGAGAASWSALRERPTILLLTAAGVLLVYASASSQHAITWLVAERGFEYSRAALALGGRDPRRRASPATWRSARSRTARTRPIPRAGSLALAGLSAVGPRWPRRASTRCPRRPGASSPAGSSRRPTSSAGTARSWPPSTSVRRTGGAPRSSASCCWWSTCSASRPAPTSRGSSRTARA